jgi:SagB-type dehydrogenase family enzyme
VATHGLNDLEDGLYHFAIHRHCLYPIRKGDVMTYLVKSGKINAEKQPVLIFLLSAIYFRSGWKYRERSYRYHLLDTGHLLENLVLALNSQDLNPELTCDFNDNEVNDLLGLDNHKEVVLAAVSVFGEKPIAQEDQRPLEKLAPSFGLASRVAAKEVDYPAVREIHSAGSIIPSSTKTRPESHDHLGLNITEWIKNPIAPNKTEIMTFAQAVYQRRSKRNFVQENLKRDQFDSLMNTLCEPVFSSDIKRDYLASFTMGILVNQVEKMESGFYIVDHRNNSTGLVSPGQRAKQMARICLDQAWLANAALHVVFLTNLKLLEETWGPRGYRYAMMSAGRLGQRIYLAATAMGLGCCGIGAFYDLEASDLLDLNQESRLLYLVALGPVKGGS